MLSNELNNLSEKERELALQILKEMSQKGTSQTYEDLKYSEYKEIPVDIETFLTDNRYLGQAWKDAAGKSKLYPFWLERLKEIFPDNVTTNYNTLLESGARGIGKSDEAVNMASTALEEVGKVGDFARAFYIANKVLTDALLIYVGTLDNVTHFKSYIVNSSTANVPVADSTFRGVRHPISMLYHSADNIDYIVKITEVKPVFGRQWMRCYSMDTQSWSEWIEA